MTIPDGLRLKYVKTWNPPITAPRPREYGEVLFASRETFEDGQVWTPEGPKDAHFVRVLNGDIFRQRIPWPPGPEFTEFTSDEELKVKE